MCRSDSLENIKTMSDKQKLHLLNKIEETAYKMETTYYGCSRSVVATFNQILQLGDDEVIKASLVLGGGVARNGEVCGALIGATMVIGLAYGSHKLENAFFGQITDVSRKYLEAMEKAATLCDSFKQTFGALRCYDVQKVIYGRSWDLRNPEDREEFLKPHIHERCGKVVKVAARLAAEILLEI